MDKAHGKTEITLAEIERRLEKLYKDAEIEVAKKADEYFEKFVREDKKMRSAVEQEKLKVSRYKRWLRTEVAKGARYKAMQEDIASYIHRINETAIAYINGELPRIYTINYNAISQQVKNIGGISFNLVNEATVRNLMLEDQNLVPLKRLSPEDVPWNMGAINRQVARGVLEGEGVSDIAKRLRMVARMNMNQSLRTARTVVTGSQNKARMDSYKSLEDDGVIIEKQWMATIGNRTRDWHADLNGVSVGVDDYFENEKGKIRFPGDPQAHPANVYNCRCTLVADIRGFKKVSR